MAIYRYSETFLSFQGEGHYTGVPTLWYRAWGCNFECLGFGQKDPDKPETWQLDFQDIDASQYTKLEDLPVFRTGCDSSYSWAKKFGFLAKKGNPEQISKELRSYITNPDNPKGLFKHPKTGLEYHMAFTGGEPMMSQSAIVDIMDQFIIQELNGPKYVTIETNGTQKARDNFINWKKKSFSESYQELFFSISPKLYISGEKWDRAIKPEIVAQYHEISEAGQLKFVCNNTTRCWDEVEKAVELYRKEGVEYPIWIMPVGATVEGQLEVQAEVAEEALKRGYNIAPRVHCFVFGNKIGT